MTIQTHFNSGALRHKSITQYNDYTVVENQKYQEKQHLVTKTNSGARHYNNYRMKLTSND